MDIAARLIRLKKKRMLTWEELARELEVSRSYINALKTTGSHSRQMGIKFGRRLAEMEREMGLRDVEEEEMTRIEAAAALAQKRGEPESFGTVLEVMHESPRAERDLEGWRKRAEVAEAKLDRLRSGMRRLLEEPEAGEAKAASSSPPSDAQVLAERAAEKGGHHSKV